MIKGQDIVCISSIDWDFIWQGHQEIMSAFAGNGNRVLFIENTGVRSPRLKDIGRLKNRILNWFKSVRGFRQELPGLYIYSPLTLPLPYSRLAKWLNRFTLISPLKKWMKIMHFRDPIVWSFLPTGTALDIINNIDEKLIVYYCIADFSELTDHPKWLARTENELLRKCDLVFAQGEFLKKRCGALNKNVHIFAFGVNMENFEKFSKSRSERPADMKGISSPVIGYIGGVHRHIDFGLIKYLAGSHPEWSFVFVGPIQTAAPEISGLKNVHMLGKKDFSLLPDYINAFDVCIIPYKMDEYTKTVFPTKMNEYHAMGKPVVSAGLPEVVKYNTENNGIVFIADTPQAFENSIVAAMSASGGDAADLRISAARNNNWGSKIERMSSLMEDAVKEKEARPIDWQSNIMSLYRISRDRLIRVIGIAAILYLIVFYTPLMWLLAEPLKISDPAVKAQAIVVFAGGVGESGRAGQGYEERVKYAAELYNKGYAGRIIFSSGYNYAFKEPVVMKALAMSLGVPKDAIILEERARNTEENVRFSSEIVRSNGWRSILLVSSPYHMRRAELVFRKVGGDIEVRYLPVRENRFYSRPARGPFISRKINLEQVLGIAHEYLGIVYYWFKGYI